MNFTEKQILEKTGLHVGRLGPDVDICMTGPGSLAQMQEALTALDRGPLSDDEMLRVKAIGDYVHDHNRRLFFNH